MEKKKMAVAIQITAGQGPDECKAFAEFVHGVILKEAREAGFAVKADNATRGSVGLKSAKIVVDAGLKEVQQLNWEGTWQWICKSPFRPHHGRRNWFVSVFIREEREEIAATADKSSIRCYVCRSRGAGGQNVNRRNTAVRAVDEATGLSVRIETERSFFQNRERAQKALAEKLHTEEQRNSEREETIRHASLYQVERGNAVRVYKGSDYRRTC